MPWALAQVYPLRTFTTESGLQSARVTALAQDHQGFMWVGTAAGVSKTDGFTFQNFTQTDGLAGDKVTCLAVDSQNRIWVGHQNAGISIISRDTILRITEQDGLINNEVNALLHSKDGAIWAGTLAGITVFEAQKTKSYTTKDGLAGTTIRALAQDAKGTIWIGTFGQGITQFANQTFRSFNLAGAFANSYITHLQPSGNDMLVGTMDGAFRFDGKRIATVLSAVGQVNAIAQVGQSSWVATLSGMARVQREATLFLSEQNGLVSNEVLCLFTDGEGILWAGTAKGLVCIPNLAVAHFAAQLEQSMEPNCLLKDNKGRLWATNNLGGVLRKEGNQFARGLDDADLNSHVIGPMAQDKMGNVWMGSRDFGGLFLWDGAKVFNYSDEMGLADNTINCLALASNSDLLIGTPNGLSRFSDEIFTQIPVSDEPSTAHITAMLEASDGRTIIGSLDGTISMLKDGKVVEWQPASAIDAPINHLCETPEGIAVATEGNGLFILKGTSLRHIRSSKGLPDANVRGLAVFDAQLLIATNAGLYRFGLKDNIVQNITASHGSSAIECRPGAMLHDGSFVWIGTAAGMVRVQISELPKQASAPKLTLSELQLFYHPIDWKQRDVATLSSGMPSALTLGYDDNYLRFHFKAISLAHPKEVRYRWILEGFEQEWTPFSTEEMANYPNLPPGDYVFKVIACVGNDACVQEAESFRFTIRPPFWKTGWFYALLVIAAVGGTYWYVKWRERKLLVEKRILEQTVEQRTLELRQQKEIVEEQNNHITESIAYARNIQMAVLPSTEEMKKAFSDHFVLYRPKETVGGDFYWTYTNDKVTWAAAIDCTGHGVAGAFMSMIGSDLLNQIIIEKQTDNPAEVLEALDKGIKLAFAQSATEFEGDKGMDVCLLRIDKTNRVVTFSGAQRPLYVAANNEITELYGNLFSISCAIDGDKVFTTQQFPLVKGMRLFLFSDGYADQFGGSKGKKFMTNKLKHIIISCLDRPMIEQKSALEYALDLWKGEEYQQVDDILVMGIQL